MALDFCRSGLITEIYGKEVSVPLTGVSVQANIIDLVAEVSIEQRYVNKENNPIEAVYKFPLDEGAAVSGFTAEVDDRVIEGVVKETVEAQEDYGEAIRSGRSAFMMEETLPDVFKAKVGNLPPGSGAKIRLTYITELKVESGEIRFYLPTTIAPRYVPASDITTAASELASVPYTTGTPFKMECDFRVKTTSTINAIRCPTHKIAVTEEQYKENRVRLSEDMTAMDRDLVLYIRVAEPNQPRLICEKSDDNSAAVMLSLVPSFRLDQQKTEFIFLVDRSGSMDGPGIRQASKALKLFLHSLPVDCYINIVGFGSTYRPLYASSQRYGDKILNDTKNYAEKLSADCGGTEIYAPLAWTLHRPLIEGYARQVFILTDGQVSDANEVISLVRAHNKQTRVFALGLGSSASHYLVEGISRAGNGTALFASLDDPLERKVLRQLQDSLQPAMTEITLQWEGMRNQGELEPGKMLRQAPSQCPPVFDGRHLVVYALLDGENVPSSVTVKASSPVGPLTMNVPLEQTNYGIGQTIHKLAAKKLIQELQDKEQLNKNKKEIAELGCRYGLASRYTSFIAVDPKQQKSLKDSWMLLKSRDVPNTVAYGWGALRSQMLNVVCDSAPPSTVHKRDSSSQMDFTDGSDHKESKDDLMKLVDAQRSDGSFSQTAVLAELLNTTVQDINDAGYQGGYAESVWATALALALLELTMPKDQESWALLATKAEIWLSSQLQAKRNEVKHDAEAFVKAKLNI